MNGPTPAPPPTRAPGSPPRSGYPPRRFWLLFAFVLLVNWLITTYLFPANAPITVPAGLSAPSNGVLVKNRKTAGFYNSVAASYGFQAGLQKYGYALFFMNEKALKYLDQSAGFEVGVGPSLVVVDEGMAKSITSTTISQDVYAFIFDQAGLMGGIGIQGSKITRL